MSDPAAEPPLDFSSPEDPASAPSCASCRRPIVDQYWSAGPAVLCEACKDALESGQMAPGGLLARTGRFSRALVFGLGGMLAGATVWYAVARLANIEAALIAILLGFLVGKAVLAGSGGRGGRRYQLLAVGLTYLGIGTAYAPLAVEAYLANRKAAADSTVAAAPAANSATTNRPVSELSGEELERENRRLDSTLTAQDARQEGPAPPRGVPGVVMLAGIALFSILTLPVLMVSDQFPGSLLSLLIYGFAIMQAWKMTRSVRIDITGPFRVGGSARA